MRSHTVPIVAFSLWMTYGNVFGCVAGDPALVTLFHSWKLLRATIELCQTRTLTVATRQESMGLPLSCPKSAIDEYVK